MSTDISRMGRNNIISVGDAGGAIVNRWAQVIAVAQPTIDAVVKLRDSREWLADQQQQPGSILFDLKEKWKVLDDDEVKARLATLPDKPFLEEAAKLFDDAVRKSAPEPWYYLALGGMLASMQSAKNIPPDYQFSVVDMILHDHDAWEKGCEPGYSAPVFVCAIREARRSDEKDFVPGPAKILKCCQANRKRFREAQGDVEALIDLRQNAEQAFEGLKRRDAEWFADRTPRPPGWKPPVYPDDGSDCPF